MKRTKPLPVDRVSAKARDLIRKSLEHYFTSASKERALDVAIAELRRNLAELERRRAELELRALRRSAYLSRHQRIGMRL